MRHLLFVKGQSGDRPPYLLVCDEIEAGAESRTFAWQLHLPHAFALQGSDLKVRGKRAGLTVHFLAPADGPLIDKETPAPLPEQRTHFIQWRTSRPQERCFFLAALVPETSGGAGPAPTFRVIDAAGGWAVAVTAGAKTDVIMFRAERTNTVSAQGVSTTGTAAVLRRSDEKPATLYVFGKRPNGARF